MEEIKNIVLKNVIVSLEPIYSDNGSFDGITFRFDKLSQDSLYVTSEREVIRHFPKELTVEGFKMDLKSLIDFTSALNNGISTAMFGIRRKMPNGGELNYISKSKYEDSKFIKIKLTKHFFRSGNQGRDKVLLSIFEDDEDFGKNEIIMIPFSKKDIQILFSLIVEISSNAFKSKPYFFNALRIDSETGDELLDISIPFVKVSNSVVFDDIWLHGQELFNLMFIIDQLNYEFEIEQRLNELNMFYRQIRIENENGIVYMILKKMNGEGEEIPMIDPGSGCKYHIKIPVSSYALTVMSMFISVKMLSHGEFEEESEFSTYKSKEIFKDIKNIKYHISTKESFIGLGYKNTRKHGEVMTFAMKVKDNAFQIEDENGILDLMYEKDGEKKIVLDFVEVSLFNQWPKLLEALSIAYTKKYLEWNKKNFVKKFFVTKNEGGIWYKYEFQVSASEGNKAAAVLSINKYKINGKEFEIISSFRQPLFKRYLYQLLIIMIHMSSYFEKNEFKITSNKKEMIKYRYMSMKKVVSLSKKEEVLYGFSKNNGELQWGIFSNSNNMKEVLPPQDIKLLNISSLFRLTRGDWLPYVGDKICIGPDRYLTDLYGEFFLEESFGFGETWASNIFFITTIRSY